MPNLYTHFAGLVVRTFPNKTDSIQRSIEARGIDVSAVDEEGRIVLNISPMAVRDLKIESSSLSFTTKFSGIETNVYAPIAAVLAIYAKENGKGMSFPEDEYIGIDPTPPDDGGDDNGGSGGKSGGSKGKGGASHLRVVK